MKESKIREILISYQKKWDIAESDLELRKNDVYSQIPEFKKLDDEISKVGLQLAKLVLQNPSNKENIILESKKKMDELRIADAIDEVLNCLRATNKYIDDTTPWVLAKDETKQDRLKTVLYNLIESIRICTVYLQAFIPETTEKIFNQINTDLTSYESTKEFGQFKSGTVLNKPEILFARIEKESE